MKKGLYQDLDLFFHAWKHLYCSKHPKYGVKKRPRAACPGCWYLYTRKLHEEYLLEFGIKGVG